MGSGELWPLSNLRGIVVPSDEHRGDFGDILASHVLQIISFTLPAVVSGWNVNFFLSPERTNMVRETMGSALASSLGGSCTGVTFPSSS